MTFKCSNHGDDDEKFYWEHLQPWAKFMRLKFSEKHVLMSNYAFK